MLPRSTFEAAWGITASASHMLGVQVEEADNDLAFDMQGIHLEKWLGGQDLITNTLTYG